MEPPDLFYNLSPDCKPIATKSRKYNNSDKTFIKSEIQRLLSEGIIEPSISPWRAQVVVTKDENHKKRLVIDYSQTVNKFTQLDAYPLPNMDNFINKIAQYKVFTSVDLKSAYHQIPLKPADRPYTAFEGDGQLVQFTRMPFGVTNGVPCFQRKIDKFTSSNALENTFAFMDNVYVCGSDLEDHDRCWTKFKKTAEENNFTFNKDKSVFATSKLHILGSIVENGTIKPDPQRLQPLRDLPSPYDSKSMKRTLGMFSHYSKWIPGFSDKISLLVKTNELCAEAEKSFQDLKKEIENSVVQRVDESLPFELECDASDIAIAAVLNQAGRPVAFFSRTLHGSELKWPPVEKEACSIIEAIRHWKHYLTGHRFRLITDQKSVSFMFNPQNKGKIKNRWRLELSCYSFDIVYRPGKENIVADTFSRVYCSAINTDTLYKLHNALCHPGITKNDCFHTFTKSTFR